jgi:hypothetical protein
MHNTSAGPELYAAGDVSAPTAVVSPFHLAAPDSKRPRLETAAVAASLIVNAKGIIVNVPHINNFAPPQVLHTVTAGYSLPPSVPSYIQAMAQADLSVFPTKVESMNPRPKEDESIV